jgi:TonB family protein
MSFAVDVVAKTTIILIVAAVVCGALRRASASTRHTVWILAMVSAVLLPLAVVLVPRFEWLLLPQVSTGVRFLLVADSTAAQGYGRINADSMTSWQPGLVSFAILSAWAFGFALLLSRLFLGFLRVRRLKKFGNSAEDWTELISDLSIELSIIRPVELVFTHAAVSAMTWGFWRHQIVLPSTAAEWTTERRRMVLAHELAHAKRNDGLWKVFVNLVCSIYWFNPLAWYAAHRIHIERERACDDQVLLLGATAEDYAEHLIQIVRALHRDSSFAAVAIAQQSQLEKRLVSILDSRTRRRAVSRFVAALLCILAGIATISLSAIGVTGGVPLPPVLLRVGVPAASAPVAPPVFNPGPKPASSPQRTRIGDGSTVPNNAVIPPRVLQSFPPDYTDEAVVANLEGTAVLEAAVDPEGGVRVLRVIKSLGYGLDQKAIDAVVGWKFGPALRNGTPVQAITQIEIDFRIPASYKPVPEDDVPPIRIGPGVTPPTVVKRVEPEYTEEARKTKHAGTVVVEATVHKDGTLTVNKVVREIEFGLTEKAIEALEQWKFKPAMKNGEVVSVTLNIEVNFQLK